MQLLDKLFALFLCFIHVIIACHSHAASCTFKCCLTFLRNGYTIAARARQSLDERRMQAACKMPRAKPLKIIAEKSRMHKRCFCIAK